MEFRVLGPVELRAGERRWEISGARQQTVLAMVLLEPGRPVSQEQLIDAVWGGMSPASAVTTLHSCVYRIRRILDEAGGPALRRGSHGYVLEVPPDSIDANRFEELAASGRRALDAGDPGEAAARLREALELWRGEAFPGLEAPAVRERAAGLADLRLDATEWCLTAELELGRHQAVLAELEALTGEHPYREALWELLMTALYRSGRQAEALDAYQRLYRLLDDELGIRPSPPLQALQQRILAGEQAPKVPEPRRTVPRMLPAGIRDFTGRAEQLKLLDGLLPATEGGAMPIVALAGTAGAGKTALAVHWAHQVADRFPDGQLYVNLRGFSPAGHPLPVGDAVRRFLDALGVPAERVPADLDAQTDLYRSQLADRRMLVVLDNAADEEQVRPLLPASRGCMVLVTSRSRLQGLVAAEAAYPIGVELLGDADAELLLIRRLGHDRVAAEPEAVGELVERCARLPLALAIVAAQAATSADLSLRAIAAHLGEDENLDVFSGTDPVTDLRAVFSWSLAHVTPAAGRLFRLLGLDPGTEIGVPATASLAGVPVEDVRPLLAELCDAHLLIELTPGRYVFHDLLCAYAYELATTQEPEAEQRAGARRVFDHYLHSAISAAVALDPHRNPPAFDDPEPGTTPEHFDDAAEAWEWFRTERPSLLEAIEEAGEYGLDTHGWHLAMAIADYFFRAGHWHDQLSSQRAALAAAQRLADLKLQGVSYRVMARSLIRLGRFEQACDQLRQGLRLSAEAGDRANQAFLEYNLGFAMSEWGRHEEAVDHTRRAIDLYDAVGNREGGASARSQLGWDLAQLGDYEGALRHCEQALAEQEELDDEFTQPETLISLGYIHHQLGDHPRARDCCSRALQGFRKLGNRYLEADTLKHLGDTQLAMGDREAARASWQEALAILDDLGHSDAEQVRARLAG